jgi:hypothetical protein
MTEEATLDSRLSNERIENDRRKWLMVIEELNRREGEVKYVLKLCESEGYYYIAPEVPSEELIHLDGAKDTKINGWTVNFSKKQFIDDPYYSWLKHPESDFILDMYPNSSKNKNSYVGRFSFHPFTQEMLLADLLIHHADTIERFGNFKFNEYHRGIYIKEDKVVLLRNYYNPKDENDFFLEKKPEFDRNLNTLVTNTTIDILIENGLPKGTKIIKYATDKIIRQYHGFI